MSKIGLVLEGGGMRGSYTLGVLDAFLQHEIYIPYVIGVSAGACNAASYASRQIGRGQRIAENYSGDKRYISARNMFGKGRSLFGMDFLFGDIPDKLEPFDYDAFYGGGTRVVIGVTDVVTGASVYVENPPKETLNTYFRASSSIPIFSPIVKVDGYSLLDGGTADPIPVKEALRHCDKVVVVLTQQKDYVKKPVPASWLYNRVLRQYPNMAATCANRHEVYNGQRAYLDQLVDEGRAMVFYPDNMDVDVFGKQAEKLHAIYENGVQQVENRMQELQAFLSGAHDLMDC